ncbi:MAG TPA: phosphoribosylanthranilate isomerase [Beijerinckiaceae bacterium]|jgi:phosphoribosylanthranilate isomerase
MTSGLVKICGLSTPETLEAALAAGADMVGFVFYPRSPRHLSLEAARGLIASARGRAETVALLVDPSDAEIDAVTALGVDQLQLHGAESPERVAAIAARTGRPVMKAIGIAGTDDLAALDRYPLADRLLLDAKPPSAGALPGGNGLRFDWALLAGLDPRAPIMLSGGLDPDNVAEAIRRTGVRAVDVSSGVESRPGLKDPAKIAAFVAAARAGFAAQHEDAL